VSAGEVPRDVTALLAEHGDDVVGLTLRLRTVLLDGHPQLVEGVRTGRHSINYRDPDAGFVCALFPMADHVQLVFERGAALPDPYRRLTGTGRQVRALEFTTGSDVDPAMVLEYLDLAVEFGTGLRSRRR
jgi:hypothetical protein